MNPSGLVKYVGALVALAICSACAGGSTVAPSSAALNGTYIGKMLLVNGTPVTAARLGRSVLPRFATILPNLVPGRKREYVINFYGSYATVFNYPKSDAQVGAINNGVGGQGCTNVLYGYGKNTFWIVAAQNQISEYSVRDNNTPIRSLSDSVGKPSSCAMDSSGDLAVGILYDYSGSGTGDVVVFKNASGAGTVYTTTLRGGEFFDGYDNQGNLFADGFANSDRTGFELIELPKGGTAFQTIATSNSIGFPGSVQWDGTYLTVLDQYTATINRYTVSGTTATLKGTVSLAGTEDCAQTWIVTGLVYCGDNIGAGWVFKYPDGGSAIASLTGSFFSPLGVTVARKTR